MSRLFILRYSRIPPEDGAPGAVGRDRFLEQVTWLKDNGYRAIGGRALYDHLRRGRDLPPRPVMLTFDAGYMEVYSHAWPALKKVGFRGLVFLVTSQIGGVSAWDADRPEELLLTRDQIIDLCNEGMEFGSAGHTGRPLSDVRGYALTLEVRQARYLVECLIQRPVFHFAYPAGARDARLAAEVWQSRYEFAHTLEEPGEGDPLADPLALPRIDASAWRPDNGRLPALEQALTE